LPKVLRQNFKAKMATDCTILHLNLILKSFPHALVLRLHGLPQDASKPTGLCLSNFSGEGIRFLGFRVELVVHGRSLFCGGRSFPQRRLMKLCKTLPGRLKSTPQSYLKTSSGRVVRFKQGSRTSPPRGRTNSLGKYSAENSGSVSGCGVRVCTNDRVIHTRVKL